MKTIELVPKRLLTSARSLYGLSANPYHNWMHVLAVCGELDAWSVGTGTEIDLATALAAVGHDIICDARRGAENERRSAELFVNMLEEHDTADPETIARVRGLILLTGGYSVLAADDTIALAFIDADYAILGQPPEIYLAYSRAIRAEWKCFSNAEFNEGRRAFLSGVLSRRNLFRTDFFRQRYERQAMKNMEHELTILGKGP